MGFGLRNKGLASSIEKDNQVSKKSHALEGVKIALVAGGGIASVQLPKMIRELRRHGATVKVFPTATCLEFIGKISLEWASGQPVADRFSGLAEHICEEDCVVVFPATTDLLAKAANGLCSDPASTLVQSALGQKKSVLFFPTMHDSLFASPANEKNIETLKSISNVKLLNAKQEEGKQKALDPIVFASEVCHSYNQIKNKVTKQKIHVTLGGTYVPLDPVRTISNHSTGTLGRLIAEELYNLGFCVNIFAGQFTGEKVLREEITWLDCRSYQEMKAALSEINPRESAALFQLAAISDFEVNNQSKEKMPSGRDTEIKLKPLSKLLDIPHLQEIPLKVSCKLTRHDADQLGNIKELFQKSKMDMLIWNKAEVAFGNQENYSCVLFTLTKQETTYQEIQGKLNLASIIARQTLTRLTRPEIFS